MDESYDDAMPPSPRQLPRFSTIHLFAMATTTALAILPHHLQLQAIRASSDPALNSVRVPEFTPATTLYGAAYCVTTGVLLFVAAAVLYWSKQRCDFRLAPGHWLALQSAAEWAYSILASLVMFASWLLGFAFLVGTGCSIVYFCGFMGLAIWGRASGAWRWTYALMAGEPVARALLTVMIARTTSMAGSGSGLMWLPQAATASVVAVVLFFAVAHDIKTNERRHWSHWFAAISRLLLTTGTAGVYVCFGLFPEAFTTG